MAEPRGGEAKGATTPLLSLFPSNQNEKRKKKNLEKLVPFFRFFIYMFGGPLFKSLNGFNKEKVTHFVSFNEHRA